MRLSEKRFERNIEHADRYTVWGGEAERGGIGRIVRVIPLYGFLGPFYGWNNVRGARRKRNISGKEGGLNELNRWKRNPAGNEEGENNDG